MWVDTLEERDRVEAHYQTNIFDMKSMLEDRIKRADDISKAYKHFKLEVAKSAEHSKTGRPISDRLLSHLEQDGEVLLHYSFLIRAEVETGSDFAFAIFLLQTKRRRRKYRGCA